MKKFSLYAFSLTILCTKLIGQPCTAIITADGPTTFCKGNSVELTASPTLSEQRADFSGNARGLAACFSIGTKAYVGTGYNSGYNRDFWEYEPVSNTWTQKADFGGTARAWATGFSIGSKGYLGTGNDGSNKNDFWEYDPAINSWTQKANFAGGERQFASSFSIGGKGYIGTGIDASSTYKKDFWEYDPLQDLWTRKADFGGLERYSATGFGIGTKGYMGTGVAPIGNNTKDFWEYDPGNNLWTKKADFGGSDRFGAVGFCIGAKGFLGCGYGGTGPTFQKDMYEFDPIGNTWTRRSDFSGSPREFAVAFTVNNVAYIGTGIDNLGFTRDFWEYTPSTSYLWSNGQTIPQITVTHSGTFTVTITNNSNGCSATSAPMVVTVNDSTAFYDTVTACNAYTWKDSTYKMSGDYTFDTVNVAGCDSMMHLHLNITSIHATYTKTDAGCIYSATGSITITPSDGVGPYYYKIGTSGNFTTIPENSHTYSSLKAGKYRITIRDINGCQGISDQITIVNLQQPIAAHVNTVNPLCPRSSDGSLVVNPTGNAGPYQYKLGTSGSFGTSNTFSGLRGGFYKVYIMDGGGCIGNDTARLIQPTSITATFTKTDETCPLRKDGSFKVTPSGGLPPYQYRFGSTNPYNHSNMFSGLKAGQYRVYIKDSNNCSGYSIGVTIALLSPSCSPTFAEESPIIQSKVAANHFEVNLSPNPSTKTFSLISHSNNNQPVIINVLDINGRVVFQSITQPGVTTRFGEGFSSGLYLVKVNQGKEVIITKVVKSD